MSMRFDKYVCFYIRISLDYVAVLAAAFLAIWIRSLCFNSFVVLSKLEIFLLLPMIFIYLQYTKGLYSTSRPLWQEISDIFRNCIMTLVMLLVYQYTVHNGMPSRVWGFIFTIILFVLDVLLCYLRKKILIKLKIWKVPLLLFAHPDNFEKIRAYINDDNSICYEVHNEKPIPASLEFVKNSKIKDFLFVANEKNNEETIRCMKKLQPFSNNTYYMLAAGDKVCANIELETFIDHKIVMLKINNLIYFKRIQIIKRIFDLVSIAVGIFFIAPFLIYICYRIKKDSKGPVIYDGLRIGQNGRLFKCYKFRSMYMNGDEILAKYFTKYPEKRKEWEVFHKLEDDPRVTPFGRIMRRTSLDELPQLFNVIKGDMSLVGPRPYLKQEMEEMGDAVNTIILAKPGITGYWQVNGRSDVTFKNRLIMDCWYIGNWSFWLDLVLLLKTIGIVLDKKGAK